MKALHLLLFLFWARFLQNCARVGMSTCPSQGNPLKREATSGLGNLGNFYKKTCFLEERTRLDRYQHLAFT